MSQSILGCKQQHGSILTCVVVGQLRSQRDIYSNAHRRCNWAKAVDDLMISQEWYDAMGGKKFHLQALATTGLRHLRRRRLDVIHPLPLVGMGRQEWPRDFNLWKCSTNVA
jgi:hypothetical protein